MKGVIGLDLETTTWLDESRPIVNQRLSIACACTALRERATGIRTDLIWAGGSFGETMDRRLSSPCEPQMSLVEVRNILDYLERWTSKGFIPITHNGTHFDFPVLGTNAGEIERAARLSLNSIDLMLVFAAVKRHRISLRALGDGFNLKKGTEHISDGSQASRAWQEGKHSMVMHYCLKDTQILLEIAREVDRQGAFIYSTRSGGYRTALLPDWLRHADQWTVANVVRHVWEQPDVWVTMPAVPLDFVDWIPTRLLREEIGYDPFS